EHAGDAGRQHGGDHETGAGPNDQGRAEREARQEHRQGAESHAGTPSAASAEAVAGRGARAPNVGRTAPDAAQAPRTPASSSAANSAAGRWASGRVSTAAQRRVAGWT